MPSLTFSNSSEVTLKSWWKGSSFSSPSGYVDFTVTGIPTGATGISAYLKYDSTNPLYSIKVLTANGTQVYKGQSGATVPITVTGNSVVRVTFVYQATSSSTSSLVVNGSYGVITFKNMSLTVSYTDPESTWTVPSSSALGSALTVAITQAASGRTHSWQLTFGSYSSEWQSMAAGVTSSNYTPPLSWANAVPNATSGTGTVTFRTQDGSGNVLHTATKSVTLTVPASVKPTAGALSVTINSGYSGLCLQNRSTVTVRMGTASGSYGSSVVSYSITGGGYSSSSSVLTTGVLQAAGTVTFTGTVTDSRGRKSDAKIVSQTVTAYAPPLITNAVYSRANSSYAADLQGTYLLGGISFTWTQVASSTLSLSVGTKQSSASAFTPVISGVSPTSGAMIQLGAGYSVENSYNVRYTLTDGISTTVAEGAVPMGYVYGFFDKDNKRLSFGSYPKANTNNMSLADDWDFYTHGQEIEDLIKSITHAKLESTTSTSGYNYVTFASAGDHVGIEGVGDYSTTDSTVCRMSIRADKDTGTFKGRTDSKAGTQYHAFYTDLNPPPDHPLAAWPVGSIYLSLNTTSPASLFGGTWTQLTDRFLIGAGGSYAFNTAGGSRSYELVAAIGAVDGKSRTLGYNATGASTWQKNHVITSTAANNNGYAFSNSSMVTSSEWSHGTVVSTATSANKVTDIIPPYLAVYMWQRTA